MQFFTAVLSGLALAAPTTTANFIAARQNSLTCSNPQIIYPASNVTWNSGSSQTVTWNTSGIPANASGMEAALFLGTDVKGYEHIFPTALSGGFYLESGYSTFIVPSMPNSTNYFVVLSIGASVYVSDISSPENRTPDFTIIGPY